ncbi:hypothetical protein [Lyngbya aestuarii]|uniref:hypothetical protein n=1 Tax=Lyngbya aestuarii TaxID=118322 RepID=UPI00403DEB6F
MQLLATDNRESQKVLSKIIAKTWLDEEFKQAFFSQTNSVLEKNGLTIPHGVEFSVNEHTLVGTQKNSPDSVNGKVVYEIPLPNKPTGLTDEQLQSLASGDNSDASIALLCGDGGTI